MTILVVVLIAVAVIGGLALRAYLRKRRRDELAVFAGQHGLEYSPTDPFGLVDPSFHLFQQGDGRGCENVVWGSWFDLPVKETDYWYYTESTDGRGNRTKQYHYFSVAIVDIPAFLPWVSIGHESVLSAIAQHLGFHDITFESEDFNREFRVKARDQEFAFKLIDPRMIQWLLSTNGQFAFEVFGSRFIAYCRRLAPGMLIPILGAAKGFHDHIPTLVWNEMGDGGSPADRVVGQPAASPAPVLPPAPPAPAQTAATPAPAQTAPATGGPHFVNPPDDYPMQAPTPPGAPSAT